MLIEDVYNALNVTARTGANAGPWTTIKTHKQHQQRQLHTPEELPVSLERTPLQRLCNSSQIYASLHIHAATRTVVVHATVVLFCPTLRANKHQFLLNTGQLTPHTLFHQLMLMFMLFLKHSKRTTGCVLSGQIDLI